MLTLIFFENTKYFNIHTKKKKVLKKLKKLTKNGRGRIIARLVHVFKN